MKNISTSKPSKTDSPKTPGGISKSFLSPCPRLGLSRNYRRNGASPFRSPLLTKTEVNQEYPETRKRKEPSDETPLTPDNVNERDVLDKNIQTPTRKVDLPRRKRSKTLLTSIDANSDENCLLQPQDNECHTVKDKNNSDACKSVDLENADIGINKHVSSNDKYSSKSNINEEPITLPHKSKSRIKNKIAPPSPVSNQPATKLEKENISNDTKSEPQEIDRENKVKSPNNLTKECVVVIQKKIFKKELKEKQKSHTPKDSPKAALVSQPVFDSDSDDIPLVCLNKDNKTTATNMLDDDDFVEVTKPVKTKSKTKLKSPAAKPKMSSKINVVKPPDSQNSDDDDVFYEKKRTIVIRKSYDKVVKPQKAKSTGSITQKDIDDLRARIEIKKKMLLARSMTEDTQELREFIKKWQKGCQNSLMELMDLMKSKFPDQQNMDYSEILNSFKIPSSLVGYDSDNECFLTPDDESVIMSAINYK